MAQMAAPYDVEEHGGYQPPSDRQTDRQTDPLHPALGSARLHSLPQSYSPQGRQWVENL